MKKNKRNCNNTVKDVFILNDVLIVVKDVLIKIF